MSAPVFGQGGEALGVLAFFQQGACEGLDVAAVGVGVPNVVRVDGAADFGDERGIALRVQREGVTVGRGPGRWDGEQVMGCALLDLRIGPPEPDQAGEAIDDRSDNPVACERELDFLGGRVAFRRCPGEQCPQRGGEVWLDFSPAAGGPRSVGRPGLVADADQPGNGKQCLAGGPDPEQVFASRPGLQRLPPPLVMQGDIAVESPGGPGIRREWREGGARVRPGQVHAVVAQEDPEAVGGVGIAGQVRGRGGGDLHAPGQFRVTGRQDPAETRRIRRAHR